MALRPRRTAPGFRPPPPPGEELAAGLRAIDDFGRWVENADAKAALIAATLGSLVAGLLSQTESVRATWRYARSGTETPAILLCLLLTLVVVALTELARAVLPNLIPSGNTRFAFPWVATHDLGLVTAPTAAASAELDAWRHAQLLARTAQSKLLHLRRALCVTGAAAALFLTWFILLTWLATST